MKMEADPAFSSVQRCYYIPAMGGAIAHNSIPTAMVFPKDTESVRYLLPSFRSRTTRSRAV